MKLRGTDFGLVWDASGVRGFCGEGYLYHKFLKPIGLDFTGSTFVSKTITVNPRVGNLPYRKCVVVKSFKGVALNAVGLPNLGARMHFETGYWQNKLDPFFISFAPVAETSNEKILEVIEFVRIFLRHLKNFKTSVGLQINISCPNVGSKINGNFIWQVNTILEIAGQLGIPIILKFNILTPPKTVLQISQNQYCDGICISNSIPFGQLPELIDWKNLFGETLPLTHLGGGGLSGYPLLSLVADWVKKLRQLGFSKYINAGGGVLGLKDANQLFLAGADSIFLGSIVFLRPWRIRNIINTLNKK